MQARQLANQMVQSIVAFERGQAMQQPANEGIARGGGEEPAEIDLRIVRGGSAGNATVAAEIADAYGVLADLDHTESFLKAIAASENVAVVFVVTDEDRLFESVAQELPDHVEPVRLYEAYLRNFEIESGRGSL